MPDRLLDTVLLQAPFWLIGAALLATMVVAALLWRRLGPSHDNFRKNSAEQGESVTREGYVVSAVLGLLALLTGFTFALALQRFDTRRERVLLDANAITAAYLQTQVLQQPHRSRISNLLRDYTDTSVELAAARTSDLLELRRREDLLIVGLWKATVAVFPTIKQYDFSSTYMERMNDVIDLDLARKIARESHVPSEVYLVLILYQIGTAYVLGYVLVGDRGRISAILLFVLFSMSIMLIIDIDRPTSGWIQTPHGTMLELQKFLRANPPSTFETLN